MGLKPLLVLVAAIPRLKHGGNQSVNLFFTPAGARLRLVPCITASLTR